MIPRRVLVGGGLLGVAGLAVLLAPLGLRQGAEIFDSESCPRSHQ